MIDMGSIFVPAGLKKLARAVASGIGPSAGSIILDPLKASRRGKALRIEAESHADSQRLISDAQRNSLNDLENPSSEVQHEVAIKGEHIESRLAYVENRKQENITAIVHKAGEEIISKEIPDDTNDPNSDWITRFFSIASDISSEQMQQIWAKILAGEIETPGRTSLRTLNALGNITQHDAELFYRASGFVIDNFIFRSNYVEKNVHGFPNFDEMLHLEHCGLLKTGSNLSWEYPPEEKEENFWSVGKHGDIHLYIKEGTGEMPRGMAVDGRGALVFRGHIKNIFVPMYPLTRTGIELFKFTHHRANMGYLQFLSKHIKMWREAKLLYTQSSNLPKLQDHPDLLIEIAPPLSDEQETG